MLFLTTLMRRRRLVSGYRLERLSFVGTRWLWLRLWSGYRVEWNGIDGFVDVLFHLELKVKRIPVLIYSIQSLFHKYNIIRYSYVFRCNFDDFHSTFESMAAGRCLISQLRSLLWQYPPQFFENSSLFTFWTPSTIPPMFQLPNFQINPVQC